MRASKKKKEEKKETWHMKTKKNRRLYLLMLGFLTFYVVCGNLNTKISKMGSWNGFG
jgi:hypothetical protein